MKKSKIIRALGESEQEIVDNLRYFLKMPFKAQAKEDEYFDALEPLYHQDTGLYANNTNVALEWALNKLEENGKMF